MSKRLNLPDALVATTGETYSETNTMPWGDTETTYLTADGIILGYSHAWSDPQHGASGVSYNDAEWNHLGSSWEDEYGSGYHHTVEAIDTDGSVTGTEGATYYIESGSHTHKDPEGNEHTSTHEFKFDENWNMLGGTEKRGDTDVVFGANWEIISETTDTSNLDPLTTEQLDALPDAVVTALFGTETAIKYSTEKFDWGGGTQTTFMMPMVMYLDTKIIGQMTGMEMVLLTVLVKVLWMRTGTILAAVGMMNGVQGLILLLKSLIQMEMLFRGQNLVNIRGKIMKVSKKPEALSLSMTLTGT